MTNFFIPQDLLQAVGNYLSTRPYREVAGMVQALESLKPVQEKPADDKEASQ